ncbi:MULTISPECIES: hypothetical protein [unclassified Sphingomonas]|uniref:hypothetical protein n=1 Tax=unclassified Sphingomonas TaxID=196159 RepID=UPI0009270FD7|nr:MULTISPECIES: hypothetical protein [unclassified Sphingomonas]OJU16104.1 MAG: hypothetical protein BGN95_24115 [Sphingomonas sp. 66-10]
MSRTFTRAEFYDLVWSKPMTRLAKEFALSDVALHKICKKHDIPNPPLGWWAKKAAGKAVKQTPLPNAKAGISDRITIAAGELRPEPELIATARENARLLASSIDGEAVLPANPIVDRTIAQLRKAKPSAINGLVTVEGLNVVKASVAPASIDRLELALGRIAAAAEALGIKLARGEKSASFQCDGETIAFSISEGVRREKHVPTEKELAEQEAARKRRARRWNSPGSWDDDDFAFSSLRGPEWDYHPTGQLAFELEQSYLLGGSPRRSFRDAKVQRIETMASDIAVGIAVLAAAKKDDRLKREEQARRDAEARRLRELALRRDHIAERRGKALDEVLEEMASLDRLRRLVANLRAENLAERAGRVAEFLVMAERRLASREAALSADGLEQRFEKNKLFGDDDDHAFRPPYGYY